MVRRRAGARLWLPVGWLSVLCGAALLAPWIAPKDPLAQDLFMGRLPPFWMAGAEPGYWLGTDSLGRDVLSRIIHGARVALTVALVAGTLTCLVGATLGVLAGFLRGWVDLVISRLIDIWMAFPPVLFSVLLIAVLGPGLMSIVIAIVVIDWTRFARVVRAEAMAQGAMDYVASARVAGRGRTGIMLREILPNVLPTIVVLLTLEMGIAVIVEAILSFVNLSISTDDPTWGGMISEGRTSVHQAWWVLVFPLVTLFLTVLSFSQLGEGLKDRFDPVLR
ncbi:MAG: ABC transporter permease [Gemmobacter sp.]